MKLQKIRDLVYGLKIPKKFQEFLLEVLRVGVVAALSAVIAFLLTKASLLPAQYQPLVIAVLTAIGKALDKYKFVDNSEKKVSGLNNYGLIGF